MAKIWKKAYRHGHRSPRFEALPFSTRAAFDEFLAFTDDNGWIRLGTADWSALLKFLGVEGRERRTVRKHLQVHLDAGRIERSEGGWFVASYGRYQADHRKAEKQPKSVATSTRPEHDSDTATTRSEHDGDTMATRSLHPVCHKSPESLGARTQRERESKREKETTPLPPKGVTTELPSEAFERLWIEGYQRVRGHRPATYPKHALAAAGVAERAEAAGVDFDWLLAGCMAVYWAEDWVKERRNQPRPMGFLANLDRIATQVIDSRNKPGPAERARWVLLRHEGIDRWWDRQDECWSDPPEQGAA